MTYYCEDCAWEGEFSELELVDHKLLCPWCQSEDVHLKGAASSDKSTLPWSSHDDSVKPTAPKVVGSDVEVLQLIGG